MMSMKCLCISVVQQNAKLWRLNQIDCNVLGMPDAEYRHCMFSELSVPVDFPPCPAGEVCKACIVLAQAHAVLTPEKKQIHT